MDGSWQEIFPGDPGRVGDFWQKSLVLLPDGLGFRSSCFGRGLFVLFSSTDSVGCSVFDQPEPASIRLTNDQIDRWNLSDDDCCIMTVSSGWVSGAEEASDLRSVACGIVNHF